MKILVAVKQVAFLDDEFEMRDDGRDVDADFFEKDLNEFDHFSVEEAMLIKEAAGDAAEVVIAIVGDEDADDALRTALAKGADRGIRVWDDALAEADEEVAAVRRLQPIAAGLARPDHRAGVGVQHEPSGPDAVHEDAPLGLDQNRIFDCVPVTPQGARRAHRPT